MIIDTKRIPADFAGSTLKALCHLAEAGPARVSDLARSAGISTAAATGLIDRAEKLHLVTRTISPTDRRAIVINLTKHGIDQVDSMRPTEEVGA